MSIAAIKKRRGVNLLCELAGYVVRVSLRQTPDPDASPAAQMMSSAPALPAKAIE